MHNQSYIYCFVGLLANRPQLEARRTRQLYGNQRLQRQLEGAPDDGHKCPKHVERCLRNKAINFKFIVHLVGCFIEYLKMHGTTNPKCSVLRSVDGVSRYNLWK
jgi:hypothetical protein